MGTQAVTANQGLARSTDPVTSHEAAALVNVTEREELVLNILNNNGSMNAEEVALLAGAEVPALTPRFRPLANKGLIYDTGRTSKALKSNRQRIIWAITPAGVAYVDRNRNIA